jgi:competence protein ComEC
VDIFTCYVGQGALAVVRHSGEAVIVDSFIPEDMRKDIEAKLTRLLRDHKVSGLVLTGFDADHACPDGVDLILSKFEPDWVMYPKYYKDTDSATEVFEIIKKHEQRRASSARPLRRVSVRLDRVDSRVLTGLSAQFQYELFSPHIDDMDNSNCSSIVLKLTGNGGSGFSYLITGDTENDRWKRINELFKTALRSSVLAAPHHGSKNAANAETIILVEPNTVLISAGVDNQYGHPDPAAVAAYARVAKHVFATNVEGGVCLFTKRNGSDFETQLAR